MVRRGDQIRGRHLARENDVRMSGTVWSTCATCGQMIYQRPSDRTWRHRADDLVLSSVGGSHAAAPDIFGGAP